MLRLPDFSGVPLTLSCVAAFALDSRVRELKQQLALKYQALGGRLPAKRFSALSTEKQVVAIRDLILPQVHAAVADGIGGYEDATGDWCHPEVLVHWDFFATGPAVTIALGIEVSCLFYLQAGFLAGLAEDRPAVARVFRIVLGSLLAFGPSRSVLEEGDMILSDPGWATDGMEPQQARDYLRSAREEVRLFRRFVPWQRAAPAVLAGRLRKSLAAASSEMSDQEQWIVRQAIAWLDSLQRWSGQQVNFIEDDSLEYRYEMASFFLMLWNTDFPASENMMNALENGYGEYSAPAVFIRVESRADLEAACAYVRSLVLCESIYAGGSDLWN